MVARLACIVFLLGASCASSTAPQQTVDFASPAFDFTVPVPDFAIVDLIGTGSDMPDMPLPGTCPTGTIPSSVNTLYAGDTAGGTNLVTNTHANWGADPDHALLFVAPKAGDYQISITSTNNFGNDCGVVVRNFVDSAVLSETSCPAVMGTVGTIDGVYAATPGGTMQTIHLSNAQHALLWVSCAQTAINRTMVYTVKVVFQ